MFVFIQNNQNVFYFLGTALGGDCSSVACADANAECPSNVCVCKSGYFHKSDDVCTIRKIY